MRPPRTGTLVEEIIIALGILSASVLVGIGITLLVRAALAG